MPLGKLNSIGMTLIELTIALGLTAVVAGAACVTMVKLRTDFMNTESLTNLDETQNLFKNWLSGEQAGGATCAQILKLNATSFDTNAATQMKIVDPSGLHTYSSDAPDAVVPGLASFTITKLYADSPSYLRTETVAGVSQRIYLATLWLEGKTANGLPFLRRPLTSLTVRLDPSGQLLECNVQSAESAESNCSKLAPGYSWSSGLCFSTLQHDPAGNFACASGSSLNADGTCHPQSQSCPTTQIAQVFVAGTSPSCISYH